MSMILTGCAGGGASLAPVSPAATRPGNTYGQVSFVPVSPAATYPGNTYGQASVAPVSPAATHSGNTYSMNLFASSGVRNQGDDHSCTAAATMIMLNFIASKSSSKGDGFAWKPSVATGVQTQVMTYEWGHMTATRSAEQNGADENGWRNALNYFGWGSMTAGVYVVKAYDSYTSATAAAVKAMARTGKPVGYIALHGDHAEVLNGFSVTAADPATSDAFKIVNLFVTDSGLGYRNHEFSYSRFSAIFDRNLAPGSTQVDPITGTVGDDLWMGKWILIEPVS
jgi:hypothetical protein